MYIFTTLQGTSTSNLIMFIRRDLVPKANKQTNRNSFKRKETKNYNPKAPSNPHFQHPSTGGIRLQAQASDSKGVKPFRATTT
jgi:hypothetical protein